MRRVGQAIGACAGCHAWGEVLGWNQAPAHQSCCGVEVVDRFDWRHNELLAWTR
ncbi:MAG: hypothetical protein ACI9S9_003373 [Planctomycetota bacterium]